MELRWDGVRSLAEAMAMLKSHVTRTPAPGIVLADLDVRLSKEMYGS
jgi:predicted amidohydrolase YtcJ